MSVHLEPVRVRTGSDDTEGHLVFAADLLVAVLVRLSDDHEEDAGKWFLEAGFDGADDPVKPKFADLDEAQEWIRRRLVGH
ncbi:hypothetical protein [Methylobacterium frigidaeris]|jgi:hypothetical protein|uniref:Uncharacterized protein n=1 Tax=Methylobacterium frigidaeris TaxID=2038277 RepID=A0AA37HGX2_9HYPH|nr:hypothetical protein [Methylobacterium frigidaeris]PIK71876.1 hypothetical protein CS379_17035 [Methylobacterium frigidaeris]GJD65862.1 hypothetical protein MPEAHAMD_6058 [Methylobacterium frigidaeris]